MNYGFTGTQSPGALATHKIMHRLEEIEFLPGDKVIVGGCIGVDAIVGRYAYMLGLHVHVVLPANHYKVDPEYRFYATTEEQMPSGSSYMERNDRIIELSDDLSGFPKTEVEELRSGTWSTIRRGRKKGIPVTIIPVGGA